jgi:asparagine synthetase B (glutamine-hydrolysing)
MVAAMKHEPSFREESVEVPGGAVALLEPPLFTASKLARDDSSGAWATLCGHGVSGDDGAPALYRHGDSQRRVDPQLLLRALSEEGEQAVARLNGVFALAYHDPETGAVTVASDRYGWMPLYYYHEPGLFVFASEVKAILCAIGPQQPDWESYADYFYIGHLMEDKTLVRGIRAIAPAEVFSYRDGRLSGHRYHDFTRTPISPAEDLSAREVADLFTGAVYRKLDRDKPNTILLSGGFDSRLILGTLHRLQVKPQLVTIGYGQGNARDPDAEAASQIAAKLGMEWDYRHAAKHYLSSRDSLEAFYVRDGMVPTWPFSIGALYRELDPSMGVVWDGLALGMAIGASYDSHAPVRTKLHNFAAGRFRYRSLLKTILAQPYFHALDHNFKRRLRASLDTMPESENRFNFFVLKHRARRRLSVNAHQLWSAKAQPIAPVGDKEFLDHMLAIPSRLRMDRRLYAELYRREFPELTTAPVLSGKSAFDFQRDASLKASSWRTSLQKRAPATALPLLWRTWNAYRRRRPRTRAQEEIAGMIIPILAAREFDRPIYNAPALRRLFAGYREGDGRLHDLFTVVFHVELWHQLFLEGDHTIFSIVEREAAVKEAG